MPQWASRMRGLVALAVFVMRLLRADELPGCLRVPVDVRPPPRPDTVPRAG